MSLFSSVPAFIGLRYTRAKRRNQFISFVSLFSFLGMGLGVFALIVVLSVMNGFDREIKERVLSVVPHGFITYPEGVKDWQSLQVQALTVPGIEGASPYIQGYGLLSYGYGIQGVEVQGVDPDFEAQTSRVSDSMLVGKLEHLAPGEYGVVIGRLLARYLGVNIGDSLTLTLPQVSITPAGVFPRQKRVKLIGVFEVGAQVDQNLALVHVQDAAKLFRKSGKVDGVRVRTDNIYTAGATLEAAKALINPFSPDHTEGTGGALQVKDWSQTQGGLFQAVKMEKVIIGSLLMIIVAVAAFNIITSLVLMVADKRADIAVLRTLGMTPKQIMAIFVVQGTAVGVFGIVCGAVSGSLIAAYLSDLMQWFESVTGVQLFDPTVFFVAHLPSVLQWQDVVVVCTTGIALSLLATLYPAYRAAQIQPAEALRYE
ncbi:lipoprotein-releasing ABC transporter permease subunit [Marinibactrum halimedae]|uniref:Multidrug ABC transporter substrate-binding protein n=1 Tax=Marinibactrum halimedae TaxID=1444977 RepID=A0AA37TAX2_9GAMM|nr:lipoprotein-releasing ABC transporter permease subunit [Marinibactrum halimedae]MCD9461073.1 lipoprotein-releasing ABC transporter permease subunit [Marinibactrum halimedae]GLS26740.1 multidrug ABC transporter substrate-binding protein [Marinibactrum halimedae]